MNIRAKVRRASVAAALCLVLAPAARAAPSIFGFNFSCWGKDCYEAPAASQSLQALARTGARWIAVTPTWYMDGSRASSLAPSASTPSDESVRFAIRQAKALGLSVALKPHVDLDDGNPRSDIDPRDDAAWFKGYRAMILHYASIAAQEHADLFVVGTELLHVDGPAHLRDWRGLIAAVRSVYHGPLTYAANCYNFVRIPFWGDLDYIGIDGYFPVLGGDNEKVMEASWQPYKLLIEAESGVFGKPVLFTEIGISSQKGANLKPWDYSHFGRADDKVQAAYLESFLHVFSRKKWFAGFLQWDWEADASGQGAGDKSMSVRGKPALQVLTRYFDLWRGIVPPSAVSRLNSSFGAHAAAALRLVRQGSFDGKGAAANLP
ncbi:MAG: hypothetical protein KGI84_04580 [Elusimicrobia bacterium]|nr:hypothetical protein [Elusimicrobiota bacterium]